MSRVSFALVSRVLSVNNLSYVLCLVKVERKVASLIDSTTLREAYVGELENKGR